MHFWIYKNLTRRQAPRKKNLITFHKLRHTLEKKMSRPNQPTTHTARLAANATTRLLFGARFSCALAPHQLLLRGCRSAVTVVMARARTVCWCCVPLHQFFFQNVGKWGEKFEQCWQVLLVGGHVFRHFCANIFVQFFFHTWVRASYNQVGLGPT